MPYGGLGNFEVEIIYSRDELCKNETI